MNGKDYSEEAYHIALRFDDLMASVEKEWRDDQAKRFDYDHAEPIRKALSDIRLPIESIVDLVESKLDEIRSIANDN